MGVCIAAGIAAAGTITTAIVKDQGDKNARNAASVQQADAETRAGNQQMAQSIFANSGNSSASGDPTTQQYLQQMGYLPPSGAQGQPDPSNSQNGTPA